MPKALASIAWIFFALVAFVPVTRAAVPPLPPVTIEITHGLTAQWGYPRTTVAAVDLTVKSDTAGTASVLVSGAAATWNAGTSSWAAVAVPLLPGINRVVVQALDGDAKEIDRSSIDVWYDTGSVVTVPAGNLAADTTWTAAGGPYKLAGNLTVPSGKTLTIEPGTTVFMSGFGITINGKLDAQGTEYNRIRFTRQPATSPANGKGLHFEGSVSGAQSTLSYADLEYLDGDTGASPSGNKSPVIFIRGVPVIIDRITVLHCAHTVFDIWEPKVIIRHSVFNDVGSHYLCYVEHMLSGGWFLVDGNLFGNDSGDNDIFHVNHVSVKNGPVAQFYDNVFTGAGDDIIDDNETDTHIEGNFFFMDIDNPALSHPTRSASAAVTTGPGGFISGETANLATQHLTVVRNIFYKNQYAILSKTGGYSTIINNVFIENQGAILFDEVWRGDSGPGRGSYVESCIFWDNEPEFQSSSEPDPLSTGTFIRVNNDLPDGHTQLAVNNSVCLAQFHKYGTGNIDADPKFVNTTRSYQIKATHPRFSTGFDGFLASPWLHETGLLPDVRLALDSPCRGTGFNGTDMGFFIPIAATITGIPSSPTSLTEASIQVAGLDLSGYKYRVLGPDFPGTWSPELMTWKVVNQITHSGAVATATTAQAHGFADGDSIEIIGADREVYNGTFPISDVTATTFTYTLPGVPAGLANMTAPRDIWCRKPEKIHLTDLANGTYEVDVVRKNTIDIWQDEASPTVATWTVSTGPRPEITSVDPGEALPGAIVTVTGTLFQTGIEVFFHGTASPEVTFDPASPGSLTAEVPDLPAGSAPITVRNSDGGASAPAAFTVLARPQFIRGDANMDASVDISDAVKILFHLFGGLDVACADATNVDSNEIANLSDAIFLLEFLFRSGPAPGDPFPSAGIAPDATPSLGCEKGL